MGAMGIDGLVSGLKTTDLINQLMQVEAVPQSLLKQKQTSTNDLITGLQALNTKVASMGDAAKTAAKAESWQALTTKSSATSVTAAAVSSATSTAQPGTVTFRTDKLAQAQVSLVDPADLAGKTTFTVKVGDKLTEVTASSSDPRDIAAAINKNADLGVVATTLRTNDTEPATYQLQLTGAKTGTNGAFSVYADTKSNVEGGTVTAIDLDEVQAADNAKITLFAGTPNEKSLTSQTNTFTGLTAGVDVTISKVETDPVTVTISRDDAALKKLASNVVSQVNLVLSEISSRSKTTTKTNTDGTTTVTGGLFTGVSAARDISDKIVSAVLSPVGGKYSPSEMGITFNKDGSFTFDDAKFAKALAADPAKVQAWTTEIAERVSKVAKSVSDPIDGSLTKQITGQQDLYKSLGTQIESWDKRLALRRESLQSTYTALEVSLSNLQSQQSWLTSQLASLA